MLIKSENIQLSDSKNQLKGHEINENFGFSMHHALLITNYQ